MSEWINEWMNEWVNKWMNVWISEWMNEWIIIWINKTHINFKTIIHHTHKVERGFIVNFN